MSTYIVHIYTAQDHHLGTLDAEFCDYSEAADMATEIGWNSGWGNRGKAVQGTLAGEQGVRLMTPEECGLEGME